MTRAATIRTIAGRALTLGSVATLAAALTIAGCTTDDTEAQTQARLDRVSSDLPPEWVAQTRGSLASAQDRRIDAEATRVRANADYSVALSDVDLDQQYALGDHDATLIEASRQHAQADADNQFNRTAFEADTRHADLDRLSDTEVLAALIDRNSTELSTRRAQANRQWHEAQATHEQMVTERIAAEIRGESAVAALEAQVESARINAQHAAAEHRAAAHTANVEAESHAERLQIEADSLAGTNAAEPDNLRKTAAADLAEGDARSTILHDDAELLREIEGGTNYNAELARIESDYRTDLDRVRLAKADARVDLTRVESETARRSSNIAHSLERSRREYESSLFAFERVVEEGLAKADQNRAHADFIERVTDVRAANTQRQRTTDQILAEVLDGRRTAELSYARTETQARVRAAGADDLASLLNARRGDQPQQFERRGAHLWRGDMGRVTTATVNGVYPANLDPSFLGAETGHAYAEMLRTFADADERELHATIEQLAADFATAHAENLATHDEMIAGLVAYERSERARVDERFATADAELIVIESERNRALASADASRNESLALGDRLDAEAETILRAATNDSEWASAHADSLDRDAQRRIEALEDQARRVLAAGVARRDQMLAQADATEQDHLARLAMVSTELDSRRATLNTQLAQLDAAAGTFAARTRASFDESTATMDAFRLAAAAEADELKAAIQATRMIDEARFEERRVALDIADTAADTERQRLVTMAKTTLERAWTDSLVARAEASQQIDIAMARADATALLANTEESQAMGLFESQLAQYRAAKNQAYADLIVAQRTAKRNAEDAVAAEQLHRALAEHAVARLELLENQRLDATRPVLVKYRDGTIIVRPKQPDDTFDATRLADVPEPIDGN